MTATLSMTTDNTLSSDGKTKARKSSPAASSRSIWQSCVDNLLATYAINMTFCSWIRLENLVGFLASLAAWWNLGGQSQGHIHQGSTSEQNLQEINFMAASFEIYYFYFFKAQGDILTSPIMRLIAKAVWRACFIIIRHPKLKEKLSMFNLKSKHTSY